MGEAASAVGKGAAGDESGIIVRNVSKTFRRAKESVGVQARGGDGFEDEDGFQNEGAVVRRRQDGKGAVAGFGAEQEVHRAGDHGMVPGEEGDVFAAEGAPSIASGDHSLGRDGRKGIGDDTLRIE